MDAFSVIGKEGASQEGEGFVQKLWQDTNSHFDEIAHLAKRSEEGLAGFWGLMTGPKREFEPWEDNFTKGLYLAGVETEDNALAPQGAGGAPRSGSSHSFPGAGAGAGSSFPELHSEKSGRQSRNRLKYGFRIIFPKEIGFEFKTNCFRFCPRGGRKFAISHFLFDFYRLQGDKPDGFPLYRMTDQTNEPNVSATQVRHPTNRPAVCRRDRRICYVV